MGLIIDANKAADYLNHPNDPDHEPIYVWIEKDDGKLAFGGRLTKEWLKLNKAARYIRVLLEAGRAVVYANGEVNREETEVKSTGLCTSDDQHIVALARISGVRLLFSKDGNLCDDFRNTELVPRPPGKIYRKASHASLLRDAPKCRKLGKSNRKPHVVK